MATGWEMSMLGEKNNVKNICSAYLIAFSLVFARRTCKGWQTEEERRVNNAVDVWHKVRKVQVKFRTFLLPQRSIMSSSFTARISDPYFLFHPHGRLEIEKSNQDSKDRNHLWFNEGLPPGQKVTHWLTSRVLPCQGNATVTLLGWVLYELFCSGVSWGGWVTSIVPSRRKRGSESGKMSKWTAKLFLQ